MTISVDQGACLGAEDKRQDSQRPSRILVPSLSPSFPSLSPSLPHTIMYAEPQARRPSATFSAADYDPRRPSPAIPNDRPASQYSAAYPQQARQSQYDDYDADGDDFFQSQEQYDQPYPARSVATQSIRAPSPPPGPLLDHSHLRPGNQAALLSHERTLELYRANAKKTQDPDLQFEFAVFMVDASKTMPIPVQTPGNVMEVEKAIAKREGLVQEALALLKRNADRGHMPSQYFLADCYANGIGTNKARQDFDRAFPLFVLAAKHGHPDASYRAGTCCENGWGCRRESAKAVQFYKKAAAAGHPGALYRLGIAELNGELGLSKSPKEGVKYLKRSAEAATAEFPHALHELALLHERGIDNVLFVDYEYAAELLAQAAELGYSPSAYRLGECYEYGKMGCPQDPALSIHYYVRSFPTTGVGSRSVAGVGCIFRTAAALLADLCAFMLTVCPRRTSLRSRTIETRASRSPHGTWSAHQACFPSPTRRHICGHAKRQKAGWSRRCMRSDTS